MPNWCNGIVTIRGKKKDDVRNFCKLFVFDDETGGKKGKYFARSFIHQEWKDFKKEYLNSKEVTFLVDFAWSAYSCIIAGYPNGKECVTLEWACKKYNVDVEIETEEGGLCFEEHIIGNNMGVHSDCEEMKQYECSCGTVEAISKHQDLEDYPCHECGKSKWKKYGGKNGKHRDT